MAFVARRILAPALGIVSLAIRLRAGGASLGQVDSHVQPPATRDAAARAVTYLSAEVPRWRREHECYSCHNNGDAARALIAASAKGFRIGDVLDDTLAFLTTPERWNVDTTRGGSEDLPLARVQFAAALTALAGTGRAPAAAVDRAATLVAAHQQRDRALAVLKRGQGTDCGWGPYVSSQSEPFDTALAVIGLSTFGDATLRLSIEQARAYLVGAQNGDGSWPETTRPPGGESYAQRISTTAWALLALLEW
jgi:squalene-hopene cyclase-like protein